MKMDDYTLRGLSKFQDESYLTSFWQAHVNLNQQLSLDSNNEKTK